MNLIIDFFGASTLFSTVTLTRTWWYMSAAIVFVLLVPLLFSMGNKSILWLLLIFVIPRTMGIDYQGPNEILSFTLAFFLGFVCSKYEILDNWINWQSEKRTLQWTKFLLELFLLWVGYNLYNRLSTELFWDLKWSIYPLLVIAFCTEYIISIPILGKILLFVGKHSMNIYFLHIFIKNFYLTEWLWSFKYFLLIVLILLLSSLLVSILIEKIKKYIRYDQITNMMSEYIIKKLEYISYNI